MSLIAIIPFNSLFRLLRISRLFRLTKLARISKIARLSKISRMSRLLIFISKFKENIKSIFKTNGFIYMVILTSISIFLAAVGIYYVELGKSIESFGDALWWAFVTATTVGYGDLSPVTGIGRFIAMILMLLGIGFIGMLTSSITTFFVREKNDTYDLIKNETLDISGLTVEEKEKLLNYMAYLKYKR